MGCACSASVLARIVSAANQKPPKAMLPSLFHPQRGANCTIRQHSAGSTSQLDQIYDVSAETLGKGAFGTVRKVTSKKTGAAYALKTMCKRHAEQEQMLHLANELTIHEACHHPNIVKAFESFEDWYHVYITMEACDGGEMFDYLKKQGGILHEADARIVMQQLLEAVFYLHEVKHVAHRDLKLENLLLKFRDLPLEENVVKVIDFGFARSFEPGQRSLDDVCGTPLYMPPEVLFGPYDEKCDLWSCGVILHELLSGGLPFTDPSHLKMLLMAAARPVRLQGGCWHAVSEDAKVVVHGLLSRDPHGRFSAEQALQSPWLLPASLESRSSTPSASESPGQEALVENLRAFSTLSDFQKVALRFAAYDLDDSHSAEQRGTFKRLDTNGDGQISLQDFDGGCPELGLGAQEAHELFCHLDMNGSGTIEYSEFLSAAISNEALPGHACWEAFRICDQDGSGKISAASVPELAGRCCSMDSSGVAEPSKVQPAEGMDFGKFGSTLRCRSMGGG